MKTKQITWTTGSGNITLTYKGMGDHTIAGTDHGVAEIDFDDVPTANSDLAVKSGGLYTLPSPRHRLVRTLLTN